MKLHNWISEIPSRSAFFWTFNYCDVFISLFPSSSWGQAPNLQSLSQGTQGFTASLMNPNVQRWEEENEGCVSLSLKFLPRLLSSHAFEWIILESVLLLNWETEKTAKNLTREGRWNRKVSRHWKVWQAEELVTWKTANGEHESAWDN